MGKKVSSRMSKTKTVVPDGRCRQHIKDPKTKKLRRCKMPADAGKATCKRHCNMYKKMDGSIFALLGMKKRTVRKIRQCRGGMKSTQLRAAKKMYRNKHKKNHPYYGMAIPSFERDCFC